MYSQAQKGITAQKLFILMPIEQNTATILLPLPLPGSLPPCRAIKPNACPEMRKTI
jgi:hypothetical protein